MRLLHNRTLEIAANREDLPKTIISHCWSECFKFLAGEKSHPKMFIEDLYTLGSYMALVYKYSVIKGCDFKKDLIKKLPIELQQGFDECFEDDIKIHSEYISIECFDDNYLFSDACSLYFKGINIFPDLFGEQWRKYVPVESYNEILRQVNKTISKK